MTYIGAQIFKVGSQAANIQAQIADAAKHISNDVFDRGGCPVCHTIRCMYQHNSFSEGIWHDYKPERYGAQFDPGSYVCENGHHFTVDDEGEITNQ